MIPDNLEDLLKGKTLPTEGPRDSDNAELLVLRTLEENSESGHYYNQADFFNFLYRKFPVPDGKDSSNFRKCLVDDFLVEIQRPPGGYTGKEFIEWNPSQEFGESRQESFADIIYLSNQCSSKSPVLPKTIDVKSTKKKNGGNNNGISLKILEKLCRKIIADSEKANEFQHIFIGIYHNNRKVERVESHDLFLIEPGTMVFNRVNGQFQINPIKANQNFKKSKLDWANLVLRKIKEVRIKQTVDAITDLYEIAPENTQEIVEKAIRGLADPESLQKMHALIDITQVIDGVQTLELDDTSDEYLTTVVKDHLNRIENELPSIWNILQNEECVNEWKTAEPGTIGWFESLEKIKKRFNELILKTLYEVKIESLRKEITETKHVVYLIKELASRAKYISFFSVTISLILAISIWWFGVN